MGPLFITLQKQWTKLKKDKISILPKSTPGFVKKEKIELIQCLKRIKTSKFIRKDYEEFVDLCLIALGEPHPKYKYKSPGGLSNARWMSKAIYALKLYIFQESLKLDKNQIEKLEVFIQFVVLVYVREWLLSPLPAEAGNSDLRFVRNLKKFRKINVEISERVTDKYLNQSWYLSGELIGLSLFSYEVSEEEKRDIMEEMRKINPSWETRELKTTKNISRCKKLCDFVDSTTICVLRHLGIKIDEILDSDTKELETLTYYQEGNTQKLLERKLNSFI